jgi:diguanylate cyclase (GGDEF)-like protein
MLGNRKYLAGRLSAVIAEHQNNGTSAGLLFLDVDHCKQFNDTYGHNTGDNILRMVAKTIRLAVRASDTIGRWGGEEFLAILYDVPDQIGLKTAADKLRTLVEYSRLDVNGQMS